MKKIAPFLIVLVFVGIIVALFLSLAKVQNMVVIKEGNLQKLPLEIVLHKYQDSDCGMVIDDLTYSSEVVAPDGKHGFFTTMEVLCIGLKINLLKRVLLFGL